MRGRPMTERDSRALQMAAWNRLWAILLRVPDDPQQGAPSVSEEQATDVDGDEREILVDSTTGEVKGT